MNKWPINSLLAVLVVLGGGALLWWQLPVYSDETVHALPAPQLDEPATTAASEVAVVSGGCFWGVQGVFQHVKGVTRALSGYAGGSQATAQYETVSGGNTGHAESVQITYDPRQVSYGTLLRIFFSVAHDPTELDRQGPDYGTQYRSAVFPQNDMQRQIAERYIAQLNQAGTFSHPIVTRVEATQAFYRAEDYHQNFLALNPSYPYIAINDLPKVHNLRHQFPELYRDKPVLVTGGSAG
jgi:peptide-methionine (S)-S-oxide reductase